MMHLHCGRTLELISVFALCFVLVFGGGAYAAEDHLVSTTDLHSAVMNQENSRAKDLAAVHDFFENKIVAKSISEIGADPIQVKQAIALLSNEELSTIASQTHAAQNDFAAGDISRRDLTLIVGAIIIIVLIIAIAA